MAWPKNGTRKLIIDGVEWLWHFSGHCHECSADMVTVGQSGAPYHLFLDPLKGYFEHTPGHVSRSLRWALSQGWNPTHGGDRTMIAVDQDAFQWLPE
jgi:hypothetical protein